MDGDVFGSLTKPGREVAEAALHALDGGVWDPYCAKRYLDLLIATADGVPSLPGVLREFRNINASPLFARVLGEDVMQRIATAVDIAKGGGGILDMILKSKAQKCVYGGVLDEREMQTRFCEELLDRGIISSRGGLRERHGSERMSQVQALLRPVAADAAEVLQRRPDAKRLRLARQHALLTPETDLLGGFG